MVNVDGLIFLLRFFAHKLMFAVLGGRLHLLVHFCECRIAVCHKVYGRVVVGRHQLVDYGCAVAGYAHDDNAFAVVVLSYGCPPYCAVGLQYRSVQHRHHLQQHS